MRRNTSQYPVPHNYMIDIIPTMDPRKIFTPTTNTLDIYKEVQDARMIKTDTYNLTKVLQDRRNLYSY